jgi:hypothetical protein
MILVSFTAAITSNRRMLRDVEVQDSSTIVADDKKALGHAERDRWHSEENPWPQSLPDGFEGRPTSVWPG